MFYTGMYGGGLRYWTESPGIGSTHLSTSYPSKLLNYLPALPVVMAL